MSKKVKIRFKKPWIAYPGSTIQQNYAESMSHGYLLWEIEKSNFNVNFYELKNPCPYLTIHWQGDLESTVEFIKNNFLPGSRYRIYSKNAISQKDIIEISKFLKESFGAVEVTFKTEQQINKEVVVTSAATLVKDDLRNSDVIIKFLKDYHKDKSISESLWNNVYDLVKFYLSTVGIDEIVRNTSWSLKHIKFDNVLAYGEENIINFQNLSGIVGIFGPNRSGKSSIVGTIMYSLFNGTDRGSVKNLHVINARKPYCYARSIINVNGTDYVIERQTTKNETKKGQISASTSLNVFMIDENSNAIDLAGEQRTDTEKIIRKLIGNQEDFLLTSLSAQDEIKLFISQGSSKRRQILSRFLDLDIFDKMHDIAKNDLNVSKSSLKLLPDNNWSQIETQCLNDINKTVSLLENKKNELDILNLKIDELKAKLSQHKDTTPVTKAHVQAHKSKYDSLLTQIETLSKNFEEEKHLIQKIEEKMLKILELQNEYNLVDLKKRLEAYRTLDSTVLSLKHNYEKNSTLLKQQQKSLKILDEVPCGDQFLNCKFIKDAHLSRSEIENQQEKTQSILEKLQDAENSLFLLKEEKLQDKIIKIEQLQELYTKHQVELSNKKINLLRLENQLNNTSAELEPLKRKLLELEEALKKEENVEIISLRAEIDELVQETKKLNNDSLLLASEKGKLQNILEKSAQEKLSREEALQKMKAYELISSAFSKKGIPSIIAKSQLPVINDEIAKILQGIVDFTIELEMDDDTDSTEIYINYGDSRRIIELGSGMEKMIASIAIRVALINISSLPKTDMFIIDEGFGALDDSGVESCNRLLMSLKRYFKTIIVITHVEGIKDSADVVIEITKNEKDSKVCWNN